jgi:HEPN/RES N-terminal domain 1/RES domain
VGLEDRWEEYRQRGWSGSDKFICVRGLDDECLKDAVARNVVADQACSFCGEVPAAPFDVLMEAFMVGVNNAFEPAENIAPWEGGYQWPTWDQYDLPDTFDPLAADDHAAAVRDEIRACLVEKTYVGHPWSDTEAEHEFSTKWREFRDTILYKTRFVFWARKDVTEDDHGPDEFSVANTLDRIGELLVTVDRITTLAAGTVTYRARGHARREDSQAWGAAQLGTNLPDNATSSTRMSPAGIPLFYGADDVETALAEVSHSDPREFFTVGKFVTTEPVAIVDLTPVDVPSIFDPKLGGYQGDVRFLNALIEELRKPIDTERIHLDYVPTQVFCEHFLRVFAEHDIRGLRWMSATAVGGGCLALDVGQADCVDVPDDAVDRLQLHLVPGSVTIHQRRTDEFRQL